MALVFIVIGVWGWDEGTMGFLGFELHLWQQSLFCELAQISGKGEKRRHGV